MRTRVEAAPVLRATHLWFFDAEFDLSVDAADGDARALLLAAVAADGVPVGAGAAVDAGAGAGGRHTGLGASIEHALLGLAVELGVAGDPVARAAARRALFPADALPRRVTRVDDGRHGVTVTVKGAVEAVLAGCTQYLDDQGRGVPLTREARWRLRRAAGGYRAQGCRVLAVAHRAVGVGYPVPGDRRDAESDLVLIGLVAMADPRSARITLIEASTVGAPGRGRVFWARLQDHLSRHLHAPLS